jgi:putative restriction endonuclease
MPKFFGTPDGAFVGQTFDSRVAASLAFLHRPRQSGIHGTKKEGADSIVVSGGYPDDKDLGDVIFYTGHGGRTHGSNVQTHDQSPEDSGNAGLITSQVQGYPVRVIRGANRDSKFAPSTGYRYDGLFAVTSSQIVKGRDGFLVLQFRLDKLGDELVDLTNSIEIDPVYATSTITRRVRDSALSRDLKKMYKFACQVCGTRVPGVDDRFYSEGAHVRPLGRPHLGNDAIENLLSLCPNHHAQLDIGGMVILSDFSVALASDLKPFGDIKFLHDHSISADNASYHREMWERY